MPASPVMGCQKKNKHEAALFFFSRLFFSFVNGCPRDPEGARQVFALLPSVPKPSFSLFPKVGSADSDRASCDDGARSLTRARYGVRPRW